MKQVYRQLCNSFRGKLHTMSALSVAVLVMLCLQVAGASASSLPQNAYPDVIVTYYACVNNTTGAITIVSKSTVCKTGYHKIQWNQQGPAGPAGPQGPQGPAGISIGLSTFNSNVYLAAYPGTEVAHTATVGLSGTYYVDATALLVIDGGDSGAFCYVTSANNNFTYGVFGGSNSTGFQQASMSEGRSVSAGDVIELWCYSNGGDANTHVYDGELNAFLINSPSDHATGKQLAPPKGKP